MPKEKEIIIKLTRKELQSLINAQEYAFAVLAQNKDQDAIDNADVVLHFLGKHARNNISSTS